MIWLEIRNVNLLYNMQPIICKCYYNFSIWKTVFFQSRQFYGTESIQEKKSLSACMDSIYTRYTYIVCRSDFYKFEL